LRNKDLNEKTILVGVTGGIAAYKAAELVSRLVKEGAEVHVVMTAAAAQFIAPLTFRTLSRQPVHTDVFAEPRLWNVEHIALAERADVAVIAPATANCLAKLAHGLADDMLTTVMLALQRPLLLAPAMNEAMYLHPATQQNIRILAERGVRFIGPDAGDLACGTSGAGRMSEPQEIVAELSQIMANKRKLAGYRALVTAGGTREALDPVRYLGNRSSGRMGYAVAEALTGAGAEVVLVSTNAELPTPAGVCLILVESAAEMRTAVLDAFATSDIVVKAAAVADYRPTEVSGQKIKKHAGHLTVELEPTTDILAELGERKGAKILVGFAAETEDAEQHAWAKLRRKNLDMIVLNDVTKPGAGFGTRTNVVSFLRRDGVAKELPLMTKREVAERLTEEIGDLIKISRG
jgi:phosphopantothenoylcysteine decarboxylase/phosphopantothenate--cysteine ligase